MTDETQKNHQAIVDWAGDLVALTGHIEEALDHQLKLDTKSGTTDATIQELHDAIKAEKGRAVSFLESFGTTAGNPVIKAGSEMLGKAAGIIDRLRNDSVAKALRDDYTAINHLHIAYVMFHATALALQHDVAAQHAEEGMRVTARLVQRINHVISQAVVDDLIDNGDVDVVDSSVVTESLAVIDNIWQETSQS
jgi:hypothetical protein